MSLLELATQHTPSRPTCEVRADSPHRARPLMPQLCLAYSLPPEAQRLHPATSARFATAAIVMVRQHATLSLSTSFCRRFGEPPREIYAEVVPGDALPTLTRLPGSVYDALGRCPALLCVSARLLVWQVCPLDSIARVVSMLTRPAMVRSNRTATDVSRAAGSSSELDVDRARCSCFVCSCTSV